MLGDSLLALMRNFLGKWQEQASAKAQRKREPTQEPRELELGLGGPVLHAGRSPQPRAGMARNTTCHTPTQLGLDPAAGCRFEA